MLKVLLVDDEPFIVQGLSALIDWEKEGFEIVGTAGNGSEANIRPIDANAAFDIGSTIRINVCIGVHPSSVADSNRLAGIPSKKFLINTRLYTFSAGNKITTQMVLVKCNDFNTR